MAYKIKILLLGDGSVGKTSLMKRFVYNQFSEEYVSTIGVNVVKKTVTINGRDVIFLIWDILGQRSHSELHRNFYMGAQGALAVGDLTRPETITSLNSWLTHLFENEGRLPVVVLGNKSDLLEPGSATNNEGEIIKVAYNYNSPYFLTSAKTGENVETAYSDLGRRILGQWGTGDA